MPFKGFLEKKRLFKMCSRHPSQFTPEPDAGGLVRRCKPLQTYASTFLRILFCVARPFRFNAATLLPRRSSAKAGQRFNVLGTSLCQAMSTTPGGMPMNPFIHQSINPGSEASHCQPLPGNGYPQGLSTEFAMDFSHKP